MALVLSHLFLKLNSLLRPWLPIQRWMTQGLPLPLHLPSDYIMPVIKITNDDIFPALSGLDSRKAYGLDGVLHIVLKYFASMLVPCLVKLFHICLSTSTFPSYWTFAHIQPLPKKDHCSNSSNYRPIPVCLCLSEVFESILKKKLLKHLSVRNLLYVHQYGFCKGRSARDLLDFLTESWSYSLRDFGETFAFAIDISKAFDRAWHKSNC